MKTNLRKIFLILCLLLQVMHVYAYVIKGTVVDETGKPVRKALIIGRNSANKVVVGIETDQSGQFSSANVSDSTLIVEISKDDYATTCVNISGTSGECVDLGKIGLKVKEIELSEIVVTA